ncbi:MAG: menaquinone biosynthesis protein [Firmicutes bacterium]|nr:menaquinone biosynthesis protein [Bacillota bacterium]
MGAPRLGRVGYINCLPIFYALEKGLIQVPARIVADHPSRLNSLLAAGELEVSAVSSIAYASLRETCVVLPGLSIASDGPVWSVALLSRVPVSRLEGRRVSLTPYSATSIILLQILLARFYGIEVELFTRPPGVSPWWGEPEATLVIGDEALKFASPPSCPRDCYIYDLGAEWKKFTGKHMVYALWVARREFAEQSPALLEEIHRGLQAARRWGHENRSVVAEAASRLVDLPVSTLVDYFHHLKYELDGDYLEGLHRFYACAWQCRLLAQPVQVELWREADAGGVENGVHHCQGEARSAAEP